MCVCVRERERESERGREGGKEGERRRFMVYVGGCVGGWRQRDKEMEARRLPFWNYKMLQAHPVQCSRTSLLSKELWFLLLENKEY